MSATAVDTVDTPPAPTLHRRPTKPPARPWLPTAILLLGALYCLLPVAWVIVAATKSSNELFSTFTFAPSDALLRNVGDLTAYQGGVYWNDEAMGARDYADLDETPGPVAAALATMSANAVHLAGLLKGSGYPAAG